MGSCHVQLMSLRSVDESTTSCASYGRLSSHCLKMRVKHWSRRCLLSPFIYNAGAPSATLAAGTPERRLQGCDARSSVAVWHFAIVPTQRPPSCRRCSQATTTFHNCRTCVVTWMDTYCTFGDRGFATAGPGLWNYLPSHVKEADLLYNRVQRSLKTFFVWIVEPRHNVNCFNCAV